MDWRNTALLTFIATAVLATTSSASECCYETSSNQFSPNNWQLNFTALHSDASKYGYDFRASIDFPSSYVIEGDPWSPYVLTCTNQTGSDNNVLGNNTYDCESTYTQQFFAVFTLTTGRLAQLGIPHANNFTLFGDSCTFSNDCTGFLSDNAYAAADSSELDLGFGTYPTWAVVVVVVAAVVVIVLVMFVILRRMVSKGDPETGNGNNGVDGVRRNVAMEMRSKETPLGRVVSRHRAEEDDTDDPSDGGDGKTEGSKRSGKSSRRSLIRSSEKKKETKEERHRSHESSMPPLPKSATELGSGMLTINPIVMPSSPVVDMQRTIGAENQPTGFLNRKSTASTARKSKDIERDEEGDMGLRSSYSGRGRDPTPVLRDDNIGRKRKGSMGRESNRSLRDEASQIDDRDLPPIPLGSSRRSRDTERERGRGRDRDRDEVVERGRRSARQSHEIDGSNPRAPPSQSSQTSSSGEGRSRSLTREDREFMLEQRTRSRSRDRTRSEQMSPMNEGVFIPRGLPPVPSIPAHHQSPIPSVSRGRYILQDENDGFSSPRSSEDYRRGDGMNSPLRKSASKPDLSYRDREAAGSSYAATKSTPPSRSTYSLPRRPDDASDDNVPLAVSDGVPLGMIADVERLSLSTRRSLADVRTPAQRERDEWLARSQRSASIDALNRSASSWDRERDRDGNRTPSRPASPRDSNRPTSPWEGNRAPSTWEGSRSTSPRHQGGSSSIPHNSDEDDNLPVGATVPLTPVGFLSNPAAKYRDRTREKQYERERVDSPVGGAGKRAMSERSSLSAGDRSGTVFDTNGFPIPGPGAKKSESGTKLPLSANISRSSMFDEGIDPWADLVPNSPIKAKEDEPRVERVASPVKTRDEDPRDRRGRTKSNDVGSEDDRPIGLRHERSARTLGGNWEPEQSEDDVPLGIRHVRSTKSLGGVVREQERSEDDIPRAVRHERSARSLSGGRELERMRDYDRERDRPASPYSVGHLREPRISLSSSRGGGPTISTSNLSTRSGIRYGDDESGRQSPRYAGSRKEADDGYSEREGRRDRRSSSASKRAESRGRDGKRLWDDEIPARRVIEDRAKGGEVEDVGVVIRKLE